MSEVIFLTAQEAYNRSLEHYEENLRKNRVELKTLIDRAIENGQFKVIYDRPLYPTVLTWLRENYGYNVTTQTVGETEVYVISWEHPGT